MTLQAVPDVLRVATYNLYLGADLSLLFGATATELPEVVTELQRQLDATDFTSRARAIAAALVRSDADIVGLQEVIRWTRDSELLVDYQDELISALDELGASYQVAVESLNITGGGAGMTIAGSNIILVRAGLPVGDVDSGQFDDALVAPTPMGQVRITRSWATADVGDLTFACVHTEAYDQTVRDAQRDQIVKLLAERTGPVVLAGDFTRCPTRSGFRRRIWMPGSKPVVRPKQDSPTARGRICRTPTIGSVSASTTSGYAPRAWRRARLSVTSSPIGHLVGSGRPTMPG